MTLSPNSQRLCLLRYAIQNSKYVKYITCPELTAEEQRKVLSSSKKYFDFIDSDDEISHFTEMCNKHPQIINAYFSNVPNGSPRTPTATDDSQIGKPDFARHYELSKILLKNCVENLATGNLENLEDSLRRVGATHAESWVCTRDLLLFEDSFMWSLDKSDPTMDQKLRGLWRKIIKFILHSIIIGINNHYEKLNYVLDPAKSKFCCLETKPPSGVDPRSHESLKKLSSLVKAQAD